MAAGLGRAFAELGVPADSLQARFVDGFMYTRLRPLLRPDSASTKLPPAVVLRVATRVHPEFRRREKAAAAALRTRPWLEVAAQLGVGHQARARGAEPPLPGGRHRRARRCRPGQPRGRAARALPHPRRDALLAPRPRPGPDRPLPVHLPALGDQRDRRAPCAGRGVALHVGAIAPAHPRAGAGRTPRGVVPSSLDDIRAVSPEAAALLDEYLAQRGQLIVTRYDIDGLTLGELPGTVLLSVLGARQAEEDDHEAAIVALRARVPEGERARFDEVLGDARAVMDMRDDNGPLTFEWPAGLLRQALLSVGKRLAATGRDRRRRARPGADPGRGPRHPADRDPYRERAGRPGRGARHQARLSPPPCSGRRSRPRPSTSCRRTWRRWWPWSRRRSRRWACSANASSTPWLARASAPRPIGVGCASRRRRRRPSTPWSRATCSSSGPRRRRFNAVLSIAGAVVTAEGGPLSHAAVLARELGIPAVVGASGALDLHDGSLVEVDPRVGAVRVLTG